ncbi:MAG: LysE family transporter [Syntrophales bacterium]|nr:LysE family transporter [Syntrophales bacterium]
MLPLLTIFVSSFVIALSGALMPGPLLTVTISESPRRGAMTGPLLIAGHGILEMGLVIAIFWGLAPMLRQEAVFATIALAGAAILVWMAAGMFHALPALSLSSDGQASSRNSLVLTGILMSLANPYWSVWWVTIGLGYILQSREYGIWGVFFFLAGHILADFLWYTAISTAVAKGQQFITDRIYRAITAVCAAFLVIFACYFFYAGMKIFI